MATTVPNNRKDRKAKARLEDVVAEEVSLVDDGAVEGSKFLIMKRDEPVTTETKTEKDAADTGELEVKDDTQAKDGQPAASTAENDDDAKAAETAETETGDEAEVLEPEPVLSLVEQRFMEASDQFKKRQAEAQAAREMAEFEDFVNTGQQLIEAADALQTKYLRLRGTG